MSITPERKTTGTDVLITNAALDDGIEGHLVFRGVLDAGCLSVLTPGRYQREQLKGKSQKNLMKDFLNGERVPDVELAVRHDQFDIAEDGSVIIKGPVWIVDGLQRISAALKAMEESSDFPTPRIGATVYMNTTEEWEKKRFLKLNFSRTRVSTDVWLRSLADDIESIKILFGMTQADESSVLYKRVSWKQHKRTGELINAVTLVNVVGILLNRFGPAQSNNTEKLAQNIEAIKAEIGPAVFRRNVVAFFNAIEQSHGITTIAITSKAPQVYSGFLQALARVFTRHKNFWTGHELTIDKATIRRMKSLPVYDNYFLNLAGGGSKASLVLADHITDHLNAKRGNDRLERFY